MSQSYKQKRRVTLDDLPDLLTIREVADLLRVSPLTIKRWGKKGKFLACSNYPECKNIKNFKKNEKGEIEIVKPETLEEKCPKCGGDLIVRTGRFGRFVSCNNL